MSDPKRGLFQKFEKIIRTDGESRVGGKHEGCDYFVLDLTHDTHAIPALAAYVESCREKFPLLARDLEYKIAKHTTS